MGNLVGQNTGNTQVTTNTGNTGTGIVRYTAPQFSGLFEMRAEKIMHPGTVYVDTLRAVDTLIVRVPKLELLPANTNYTKVGGTANHHGPPGYVEDNNHYGTQFTNQALQIIATTWHREFPTEHSLYINDMSLPYGGLFDKDGNWKPPHGLHRVGESADIRTEFPWEREGVPIRTPRKSLEIEHIIGNEDFEDICLSRGTRPRIHGEKGTIDEHYHLEF